MILFPLPLKGGILIQGQPVGDERGKLSRFYCENELGFLETGHKIVQAYCSVSSKKGTIRGLHFQYPPAAEIKIVRCLRGALFDVMVDIRKGSPTYLQWHGEYLKAGDGKSVLIPEGFAHGVQTLEDDTELMCMATAAYSSELEGGLHYKDPKLAISWPVEVTELSTKDQKQNYISNKFEAIQIP